MGSTNNNTSKKQKKNRLNQALTIRDHDIRDQLNPLVGSKKTLVQGLIDFALLSANVSQLLTTISLQVQDQNTERKANIILICISIFLQVYILLSEITEHLLGYVLMSCCKLLGCVGLLTNRK